MTDFRIDLIGASYPADGYCGYVYLDRDTEVYSRAEMVGYVSAYSTESGADNGFFEFYADGANLGGMPEGSVITALTFHGELIVQDVPHSLVRLMPLNKRPYLYANPGEDGDLYDDIDVGVPFAEPDWDGYGWVSVILPAAARAELQSHLDSFYFGLWSVGPLVSIADLNYGMNTECSICGITNLYAPHLLVSYTTPSGRRRQAIII